MGRPLETGRLWRFGEFVFDRRSLELRSGDRVVHLQQQPAQVLAVLIERAGQVVTRDELRQSVWCTDTHVDFDRGLHYCINQVRAALGDPADAPRYLETLDGRAYRFIEPVQLVVEEGTSSWRPAVAAAIFVAAVLVATITWWALGP
jgi:DNA-binding winged helix-turn-helix (wHTH) protein